MTNKETNNTLKYIIVFGLIAAFLSIAVTSKTGYIEEKSTQVQTSNIKEFSFDNDGVRCYYIDNNEAKSYLSCVRVESQTVLK